MNQVLLPGQQVDVFIKERENRLKKKVSRTELQFYKKLNNDLRDWQAFAPRMTGVFRSEVGNFVEMEDLTYGMKMPCTMDLKIGLKTAGEDASPEKRERMGKKDRLTTTVSLGFRLTGARSYNYFTNEYIERDKDYGRVLTAEQMPFVLREFFYDGKSLRKSVVEKFIKEIQKVQLWMQSQRQFKIYSGSLLFVYDADPNSTIQPRLRMIDFAHAIPSYDGKPDESYLTGISNLLHHLTSLLL